MDELTLSQGIFNYKLIHHTIVQKNVFEQSCTLTPAERATLRSRIVPRNGELTILPLKTQAAIGKWITSAYERAGNSFKRPRAIACLFQPTEKVTYYYTKKDQSDNKKVFEKILKCSWINFKQVKVLPEVEPDSPIILPNGTLAQDQAIDTIPPTQISEIIELLKYEGERARGTVLFQFGVDGLDQFVHPAIKILASHLFSIRIASPGFGLNYSHPYCQAVFLRPFTNGMLSRLSEDDLLKELKPWKDKCVVIGNELSPSVVNVMSMLDIPRVPNVSSQSGSEISLYSRLLGHKLIARYYTYLDHSTVRELLSVDDEERLRKNMAGLLFCSRALIPNPEPIVRLDTLNDYEFGVVPTVNPYPLHTAGADLLKSWVDAVSDPKASRTPVILIVCAPKGSMKSTLTKRMVDYFTSNVKGQEALRFGRVDSDAWGKWLANPKLFSTWVEFDSFQNNDTLKSQIEIDMELLLEQNKVSDINSVERDVMEGLQADFCVYMQGMLVNQENGLEKFVNLLLQIPDLPRAVIWEVHTHSEIGLLPPTHFICNLMPSWNTAYAVQSRPRPTSSPMVQLALHYLYKSVSQYMIYMNLHLGDCARSIGYVPGI
ncbi:non-structural protein NSP8 [Raspberry latent virus]|uniref:non-structural protein NSP8 n=1 Tax=Raspberry latent virus TaxID=907191 RepID=UPI0001E6901F|nr:non-structural protein NSP8 [Raspberry latent virus]ADO27694.1 non-structural protein NSP8 [Raspberry latent virus]